jgi:hypothetical protein
MSLSDSCTRSWLKPGDVFEDRELQLSAGLPDAVFDQLGLERVDEALGRVLS